LKKFKTLAIVALSLAAIIAAVIYGVKLINVIILNWSEIVDWLSDASIMTASICSGTLILGYYLILVANSQYYQHGFARKIERVTNYSYSFLRELSIKEGAMLNISKVMIIASAVIFTANLFPLFNHFDLFRLWLIILGGAAVLGFGVLMIFWLSPENSYYLPLTLAAIFFLAFTYYLDYFIFSWDRPWITGIAAILVAIFYIIMIISDRRSTRKEKLEKAEHDAKTARQEQEKSEKKAQYKEALTKRLATLSLNDLILSYFSENKTNEFFHWNDVVTFYTDAFKNIEDGDLKKVDAQQKVHIAWLLSQKTNEKSSSFYKLITTIFEENDVEALLFSNVVKGLEGVLPEAFSQFANKKAVIAKFLSEEFDAKYKKVLYNKVKREFNPDELYGLLNALIYSYQKSWDEDFSAKLLERIKEIFTFGNDCLESMWQKGNRALLRKHLDAIYMFCLMNGVHVLLPAIKQEPQEKTDETSVQTQA